jgi:imidazolonepropionase-like amidohydrolase
VFRHAAITGLISLAFPAVLPAQADSAVESGRFTLHKFQQPIGREEYTLTRVSDGVALVDTFEFIDRGTPVPLKTTALFGIDGSTERVMLRGKDSRNSTLDVAIEVVGDSARVLRDSVVTVLPVPRPGFAISGYAPIALQQQLIRYWETHGRPDTLPTLPRGRVLIAGRGIDTVVVTSGPVALRRYVVAGLIWGRETLWFDLENRLIAAVTIDAEFDHFEALREGYESALDLFVTRAAEDAAHGLAELTALAPKSADDRFALVGGTLIDGTGRPPIIDATVVIEGGRVSAVGRRLKLPRGMRVVDTRGKSILPGLWDMHAHYEQVEWGPIYLASGITTVRDVGNELNFIRAVREAIAAGRGIGPRMLLAGIVDGDSPRAVGVERVATVDQALAEVRKYHDAGFQQMKLYSSLSPEMVKAVAAEAHRLGMTVTGHVPEGMDGFQGVEAGMDQINHISFIRRMMLTPPDSAGAAPSFDPGSPQAMRAVSFLKAHGTVVDPTIALYELLLHPESESVAAFEPGVTHVAPELAGPLAHTGVPAADSARARERLEEFLTIIRLLHQAGVPIVAGTDQAVPGYSLHRELELYHGAGFTPMEAIQAGTSVPAEAMGLSAEVGTVQPGKRADLLVVEGNPLERFGDLRRVWLVVAGGKRYEPGPLWRSVGFVP